MWLITLGINRMENSKFGFVCKSCKTMIQLTKPTQIEERHFLKQGEKLSSLAKYIEKINNFLTLLNEQLPEELFLCNICNKRNFKEAEKEIQIAKQIKKLKQIIDKELAADLEKCVSLERIEKTCETIESVTGEGEKLLEKFKNRKKIE